MSAERLPDFLLGGSMRSGTTSLYDYVSQHPEVYAPSEKEPGFFEEDEHFRRGVEWYRKFFEGVDDEAVVCSFVGRVHKKEVPKRIENVLPETKIVLLLRNPIDWIYSIYHFGLQKGIWNLSSVSFGEFIRSEKHKYSKCLLERGKHIEYVERFEEEFGRSRMKCVVFEEFVEEIVGKMQEIYEFAGVSPEFSPDVEVKEATPNPRFPGLYRTAYRVWRPVKRALPNDSLLAARSAFKDLMFDEDVERREMKLEDRTYLRNYYAGPNHRLEQWLGKDLSHWT
jgi:hypothetical protein